MRVRRVRCNRGKAPDARGRSRVSRPAVAGRRQRIPGEEGEVPYRSTKTFSVLSDWSGKRDEGPQPNCGTMKTMGVRFLANDGTPGFLCHDTVFSERVQYLNDTVTSIHSDNIGTYVYGCITSVLHNPVIFSYPMILPETPGDLHEKNSSLGHGHVWGAPSNPS